MKIPPLIATYQFSRNHPAVSKPFNVFQLTSVLCKTVQRLALESNTVIVKFGAGSSDIPEISVGHE